MRIDRLGKKEKEKLSLCKKIQNIMYDLLLSFDK